MRILLIAPDQNYALSESDKKVAGLFRLRPILRFAGINDCGAKRLATFPSLGLLTVAGLTPREHQIRLIDEIVEDIDFSNPADLVGITCNTTTSSRAYQIADIFRRRGIPVVLGGIHPTALPEEALEHADAVVVGEAEIVWPKLLNDFEGNKLQQIYKNETFPELGGFSLPRRDLLKPGAYWIPNTVQTTRGCPFNCEFCSVTQFFGRTYRTRPVAEVIAEVESLDGNIIVFIDDNIMARPDYSRELFEALIRLRSTRKIRWYSQASMTMMAHPDLLVLAAKSGCRGLFIGLESINSDILRRMNKSFNLPHHFQEYVAKLHRLGIRVIGAFVFTDQDNLSTIQKTVHFVHSAKIDLVQYAFATPLPGTKLWERVKDCIIEYNRFKYDGRHITYLHPTLSVEQFQTAFKSAYRKTYSYFSILSRLSALRSGWFTFLVLNLAFRQGTVLGWMTRND